MAEQPVFWLGGKPGGKKSRERAQPEAERWEATLREACEQCGYAVDEYVAALGGFGGWLVHLDRAGERYRVFWSGKSGQLTFEQARPGGWHELRSAKAADDAGVGGFVTALHGLLHDQSDKI